jgi:hypothetical protein
MNLQKIIARNNPINGGTEIFWLGSQAEASAKRAELVRDGRKRADLITEPTEVPTNKTELLAWLNENVKAV